MGVKAVIFDLDGVILNTAHYHYLAWKRILSEYGKEFSEEENEQIKGVARSKSLEILLEMKNMSMSEVEKLKVLRQKNNWYLDYVLAIDLDDLLPGAIAFLELLRLHGIKTGIASTSDNTSLILELTGLRKYFNAVIDGYKVKSPKPNPEVYVVSAIALSMHPSECLVFEDSRAGVLSAKRAGMKVVAVSEHPIKEADRWLVSLKDVTMDILEFIED